MHHHHALALLLFSIVFAAFALFTLCTFAPKAHAASIVNNPGKEDTSVSALAGLPIRRRSIPSSDDHLYTRDDILINSKGQDTVTMSDQGDLNSSRYFPIVHLMELDLSKDKDIYNRCVQEIRDSHPTLHFKDATAGQGSKSVWDEILTAITFLKRDLPHNLSDACSDFLQQHLLPSKPRLDQDNQKSQDEVIDCSDNDDENLRSGTYIEQRPIKRDLSSKEEHSSSYGRLGGVVSTKTTGPHFESNVNGIPMKHVPSNPQAEGGILQKREAENFDLLGLAEPSNKKRVVIDFKKAERDAHLANLADGFIIETEYLTPGRKVVQHVSRKPNTRVS